MDENSKRSSALKNISLFLHHSNINELLTRLLKILRTITMSSFVFVFILFYRVGSMVIDLHTYINTHRWCEHWNFDEVRFGNGGRFFFCGHCYWVPRRIRTRHTSLIGLRNVTPTDQSIYPSDICKLRGNGLSFEQCDGRSDMVAWHALPLRSRWNWKIKSPRTNPPQLAYYV